MSAQNEKAILEQAVEVLRIESEGILKLIDRIDDSFRQMVELVCSSKGRLIVSGIGKSGIVGRKIVATLNSTGTRALFLHPVEAMHGDLGMVSPDDVFLALSNSGETDELNLLLDAIRGIGCATIAFTGRRGSTLANNSDIVIDVGVEKEACPLGLAPTASTAAQLAMGDALAVVLINKKHFNSLDFKRFHPGGALSHRLSCKISDLMLTGSSLPIVACGTGMEAAIQEMDRARLGALLVCDDNRILAGIVTDGDIRRAIVSKRSLLELPVDEVMTANPRTLPPDSPAYNALNMMEHYQITILPITDSVRAVVGIVHLHDILGKGEFKFNGS
jgi:arabinose-5-phosphate isomerase